MKERILYGWTLSRVIYLAIGSMVVINAFMDKQYWGVIPGAYFASMGLFNFGCAAGYCAAPPVRKRIATKPIASDEAVQFQEIKNTNNGNN